MGPGPDSSESPAVQPQGKANPLIFDNSPAQMPWVYHHQLCVGLGDRKIKGRFSGQTWASVMTVASLGPTELKGLAQGHTGRSLPAPAADTWRPDGRQLRVWHTGEPTDG